MHKTANGLNTVALSVLALSVQPAMKTDLREICRAADRASAEAALAVFEATDVLNYAKAVACLTKDRDARPACDGVPAEHWAH